MDFLHSKLKWRSSLIQCLCNHRFFDVTLMNMKRSIPDGQAIVSTMDRSLSFVFSTNSNFKNILSFYNLVLSLEAFCVYDNDLYLGVNQIFCFECATCWIPNFFQLYLINIIAYLKRTYTRFNFFFRCTLRKLNKKMYMVFKNVEYYIWKASAHVRAWR